MASSLRKSSGFTLIELLIVVAIIGILAAIAVPNFLNAQVRAKVARAQSDLRAMATAIEMYSLDNNAPPPSTNPSMTASDTTYGYMRFNLTTPVAYLSSGLLPDPFVNQLDEKTQAKDEQYYTYHNLKMLTDHELFPEYMEDFYGTWRALSYGPDKTYANGSYGVRIYNSSNGINSFGNIIISQKYQVVNDIPEALK